MIFTLLGCLLLCFLVFIVGLIFYDFIPLIRDEDDDYSPLTAISVDIVITWVNLSDRAWQRRFEKAYKTVNPAVVSRHNSPDTNVDVEESLEYSIKLILKNLPWVRTIFILTQDQIPRAASLHDKIKVVHHRDVFTDKNMLSFNAMYIQSQIASIPGLSSRFIFMADDIFVVKPLPYSYFFTTLGLPVVRPKPRAMISLRNSHVYSHIVANTFRLVRHNLNHFLFAYSTVHGLIPCTRKLFNDAKHSIDEDEWNKINVIRSQDDFDFVSFYLPSYMISACRDHVRVRVPRHDFYEGSTFAGNILDVNATTVCFNNGFNQNCLDYLDVRLSS